MIGIEEVDNNFVFKRLQSGLQMKMKNEVILQINNRKVRSTHRMIYNTDNFINE